MFRSYEEARRYLEARQAGSNPKDCECFIMVKGGAYNIAYGQAEKEYAESLGYVVAAK